MLGARVTGPMWNPHARGRRRVELLGEALIPDDPPRIVIIDQWFWSVAGARRQVWRLRRRGAKVRFVIWRGTRRVVEDRTALWA